MTSIERCPYFTSGKYDRSWAALDTLACMVTSNHSAKKFEPDVTPGEIAELTSSITSARRRAMGLYKEGFLLAAAEFQHLHLWHPATGRSTSSFRNILRDGNLQQHLTISLEYDDVAEGDFKPDCTVGDVDRRELYIIQQTHNVWTASSTVSDLQEQMLATRSSAEDFLASKGDNEVVTNITVAILDWSDHPSDTEKGIFNYKDIDILLGTDGLGFRLQFLKERYRHWVGARILDTVRSP